MGGLIVEAKQYYLRRQTGSLSLLSQEISDRIINQMNLSLLICKMGILSHKIMLSVNRIIDIKAYQTHNRQCYFPFCVNQIRATDLVNLIQFHITVGKSFVIKKNKQTIAYFYLILNQHCLYISRPLLFPV